MSIWEWSFPVGPICSCMSPGFPIFIFLSISYNTVRTLVALTEIKNSKNTRQKLHTLLQFQCEGGGRRDWQEGAQEIVSFLLWMCMFRVVDESFITTTTTLFASIRNNATVVNNSRGRTGQQIAYCDWKIEHATRVAPKTDTIVLIRSQLASHGTQQYPAAGLNYSMQVSTIPCRSCQTAVVSKHDSREAPAVFHTVTYMLACVWFLGTNFGALSETVIISAHVSRCLKY